MTNSTDESNRDQLKRNLEEVRQRIAEAAARSGRTATSVSLVGVSKYVDASMTRLLVEAGCQDLGENRPQALWEKAEAIPAGDVRWHLIGHLQRNKVKRTVERTHLIHSVDSQRLLTAIDSASAEQDRVSNVLIEINVSGEMAKHGLDPHELPAFLERAGQLKHVKIEGLMCMAGLAGDSVQARREFASLRELAEANRIYESDSVCLEQLSMGMSRDFEIAIEEGATLVRIGSSLFSGTH